MLPEAPGGRLIPYPGETGFYGSYGDRVCLEKGRLERPFRRLGVDRA